MPNEGWRHFDPMPAQAEPPSPSRRTALGRRGKNVAGMALSLVALVYLTLSPSDDGGKGFSSTRTRASPGLGDNIGRGSSRKLDVKQVRDLTDKIEGKKAVTPWLVIVPRPWLHDQLFQYASALGMWIENGGPLQSGLCLQSKAHHEDGKEYADYLHEYISTPLMPPCHTNLGAADGPFGSTGSIVHHTGEGAQLGLAPYVPFDLDHPSYKDANTILLQHVHLQSHKYFDKLPMKSLFEFRKDIRQAAKKIIDDARGDKDRTVVVGVHVNFDVSPGMTKQAPEQFYDLAMSYFMGRDGVVFVVTSDKMELAKSVPAFNRPNVNVVFAPNHDEDSYYNSVEVIRDVATLAAADHVITSTGSTGWWGGYLGEGTVVAYQDVFSPALQDKDASFRDTIIEDYFPAPWILVGDDFLATTGILNADRRRRAAVRKDVEKAEVRAKEQGELQNKQKPKQEETMNRPRRLVG